MGLQRFRALLLVPSLLTASSHAARAQDQISGFGGFVWGTKREAILARFGKPREDLQQDSVEKINYVQGPDSGLLFGLTTRHGLVAGIRILPLAKGPLCGAAVDSVKAQVTRHFASLTPFDKKTPDSSAVSCSGYKDRSVLWLDRERNRILLVVDGVEHRLYIFYSSPLSPF